MRWNACRSASGTTLGHLEHILNDCERPEPATPRFLGIVETPGPPSDKRGPQLGRPRDAESRAERQAAEGVESLLTSAAGWPTDGCSRPWTPRSTYTCRLPPMSAPRDDRESHRGAHGTWTTSRSCRSTHSPITPRSGAMALTVLTSVARRMNTDLEVIRVMARAERAKPDAARAI